MSEKPLPFSNGLQLKSMGAVLLLVLGVLIWRLTDATTTSARVLYIGAIVFELLFFVGLVFASRSIKKQYARAEEKYQAQVAAKKQAAETPAATEPARDTAEETDGK
jgi:ABC-type nickel/cobalt efflux system permease component RcnA